MRLRVACQEPDQARGVGADEVEEIRREFRDAQQDGFGAGKSGDEISDRSRLLRCEIGQPVCQSLFGLIGSGHMRPVHEPRGQTMLVRVALRG